MLLAASARLQPCPGCGGGGILALLIVGDVDVGCVGSIWFVRRRLGPARF